MTWEAFQALPMGSIFVLERKLGWAGRFVKAEGPRWDYGHISYPESVLQPYLNHMQMISELELLAESLEGKYNDKT